jgi:hypothetical protein
MIKYLVDLSKIIIGSFIAIVAAGYLGLRLFIIWLNTPLGKHLPLPALPPGYEDFWLPLLEQTRLAVAILGAFAVGALILFALLTGGVLYVAYLLYRAEK